MDHLWEFMLPWHEVSAMDHMHTPLDALLSAASVD